VPVGFLDLSLRIAPELPVFLALLLPLFEHTSGDMFQPIQPFVDGHGRAFSIA